MRGIVHRAAQRHHLLRPTGARHDRKLQLGESAGVNSSPIERRPRRM